MNAWWVLATVLWCAFGFGLHVWYRRRHDDVSLGDVFMFLLFCWCWPVTILLDMAQQNPDVIIFKQKRSSHD